eukprot:TRINITY_DN3832_c0_g1_i1.p1 TRINITY_DN3832_c0_g1~~TRINITY_DN3832_c0_g1_i1.p1  ORF type:complete len:214 (-),score=28.44 TRINITY_DN3832_c0_g1_i1:193-834(-)
MGAVKSTKRKPEVRAINIMLLGDPGVGKTSLLDCYVNGKLGSNPDNNRNMNADRSFTFGSEKVIVRLYNLFSDREYSRSGDLYEDINAIFFCYEAPRESSWYTVDKWIYEASWFARVDLVRVLLGTKSDEGCEGTHELVKEHMEYKEQEQVTLRTKWNEDPESRYEPSQEENWLWFETSAKTGKNVLQAIFTTTALVLNQIHEQKKTSRGFYS